MKRYLLLKVTVVSIFILASFYYLSCDIKSPVQDVDVIFNTLPISTVVSGNIVDAATGEPIQGKTVYLTIEGDNKNDIVTLSSTPQTDFSTTAGFVDFALVETAKPSGTSPVKLIIVAKCTGYLTNTLPFTIDSTGDANFTISMVSESNLPTGAVNGSSSGQANNSGIVQSDFTVSVKEPQTNVSASMYIPKGTILMDANGNLLKGNVTASLTYFNNQNEESVSCLPGGYSVSAMQNGVKSDGAFLTAGFFNLSIKDANGVEAKRVSKIGLSKRADADTIKPLITVEISDNTINPETGVAVKAGDSIDVWSISTLSTWDHEQKVLIKGPNANGKFFVQFRIDHLSPWNCDWLWWWWRLCTLTVNITGKELYRPVRLVITGLYGGYYNFVTVSGNLATFSNLPPGIPYVITAYDVSMCTSRKIGSTVVYNSCGAVVNLNVSYPLPITTVKMIINGEGICNCNSRIIVRPSGNPIWYRPESSCNSNWSFAGSLVNGSITLPAIQLGVKYIYATWYEGQWYTLGATVFSDRAEMDWGLLSQNIVSAKASRNNNSAALYFKGYLSNSICRNFCK